jgi:hypothetical protein
MSSSDQSTSREGIATVGTERNSGTTTATTRHGRDRLGPSLHHRRHLVVLLVLPFLLDGCIPFAERPDQMPVYNYTDSTIIFVHRDDNGSEALLEGSTGYTSLGPGDHGLFTVSDSDWCSHGSFIARTTDGVEVARKSISPTITNICGTWTIGTPPPSTSPSPRSSPSTRTSPSPSPSQATRVAPSPAAS